MGVSVKRFDPRGFLLFFSKKRLRASCPCKKRAIPRSVLCGLMLFALGLISLLTGQIAADVELSRLRGRWRSKRGRNEAVDIWKSKYSDLYYGCSDRNHRFRSVVRESNSNGYLLIATSGGLNQQRTGITDAVVVARILNATLVVPELDHHSFWKDDSDFANIFDINWFISSLSKDVTIVKRIPDKVMRSMEKPPYTMRPPRKSTPEYYLYQVLPILLRRHAVQLTKFDYRLANKLDDELQKLRCRVNYHALRFTRPIQVLGQSLVKRMRAMSPRFIALHLSHVSSNIWKVPFVEIATTDKLDDLKRRPGFEADMLAFSGCYYGGGEKERHELGEIRKRWATLPDLSAEDERSRGKCPLTPHEVGLMLRALGFENDTYMYIASGDIYGGEQTLQPLKDLFPNFYTKEMLAGDDLKPFLPFSSRLAAIDYIVCDESDVFVTNNNGNMAKMLAGRRRYMGHKRTIRPNARKLSSLFKALKQMDWETFATKVKACQRAFLGEPGEARLGRVEFYEFPSSCICQKPGEPFGEDLKKPAKQLTRGLHQVPQLDNRG